MGVRRKKRGVTHTVAGPTAGRDRAPLKEKYNFPIRLDPSIPRGAFVLEAPPPGTAAALIAASRDAGTCPVPDPAALLELQALCDHNDKQSDPKKRVAAPKAIAMLRTWGWAGNSRSALDRLCRASLGRTSYGTA
jgi:hypothetical protein